GSTPAAGRATRTGRGRQGGRGPVDSRPGGDSVIPLSDWTRSCPLPDRPWLILGKGPSFARRHCLDLTGYNLASLNHVVRELKVDVAHYIDLDAVEQCADVLPRNAEWLLLPRYPHVNFRPSDEPL